MPQALDLHHPLVLGFPGLRDAIHKLKMEATHFRRLSDGYHEVDRAVVRIEEEIDPAGDARIAEVKHRRAHLKDKLYRQLVAARAA